MTDAVLPGHVRPWLWISPVLAVRAAFALALLLGSLAAVQEISVECSDRTVYLATDTGVLLTTDDGKLLVTNPGWHECKLRVGALRQPLPEWARRMLD